MIELLDSVAGPWWQWIVGASLRVAVLAIAIATFDRLAGSRLWPELRHALWLLVPLAACVPPGLTAPWSPSATVSALAATTTVPQTHAGLVRLAFAMWAVGVVTVATVRLARHRRGRRALLDAAVPAPPELAARIGAATRLAGTRRTPDLLIGDRGPLVTGCHRPVVVLPAAARRWSRERVDHVLSHEVAHVARGDLWAEAAFAAISVALWFHPLVAVARRRARAARELACDALAMRTAGPGYRETLLRIAAERHLATATGGVGLGWSGRSDLLERLRSLERPPAADGRRQRALTAILVGAVALGVFPGTPGDREPAETSRELAAVAIRGASRHDAIGSLHARAAVLMMNARPGSAPAADLETRQTTEEP